MGVPVTFFGSNTRAGLGSELNLDPTKRYLAICWEDIAGAIDSVNTVPNSGEDWLGAFIFKLIDLTTSDTNNTGAKITAGRRFAVVDNGKGVDDGQFESGQRLFVYSALLALYIADSNPNRPPASSL